MSVQTELSAEGAEAASFPEQTSQVLVMLRSALIGLTQGIPGGVRKSRDVQDHFGVDIKLSWQIQRIVTAKNPVDFSSHVPSAVGIKKLVKAARSNGTPETVVRSVETAFQRFTDHVELHAGDRDCFQSMVGVESDPELASQNDIARRRTMFEGWRHFLGVAVQSQIRGTVIHPSASSGLFDCGVLRSRVGLRRLRPDVPVVLDAFKLVPFSDSVDVYRREPLDHEAYAQYGACVLPEYCSAVPPMRLEVMDSGVTRCFLASRSVGNSAAVNVSFGDVSRAAPLSIFDDGPMPAVGFAGIGSILIPIELFISDMIVHRPTFGRVDASLAVFAHATELVRVPTSKTHTAIDTRDHPVYLGRGSEATSCPEVPHYAEMFQGACRKWGWNPDEFDIYRTRIEYPLVGTAIVNRYTLPPDHPEAVRALADFKAGHAR